MKEYFSHDLGARHDKKVVALVDKYKSSGYGIFWATNEMMHEEGGKLELDNLTYDAIGKHLNEQSAHIEEVIKYCISPLKLYIIDDEQLTSNRVQRNLEFQEEKKSVKVYAGRLGGINSGKSRRSKQNEAPLEANEAMLEATNQMKGNEMKRNEMKGNEMKIAHDDSVCIDAEHFIINNRIIFDKICIATLKGAEEVKKELHLYHLWLEKNGKYPTAKKAVVAGIESWILNARNFKSKYIVEEKMNGSSSSIKKEGDVDFDKYKKKH